MEAFNLKDLIDAEFPKPEVIIDELLWGNGKHVLGGEPGIGKSFFAQVMGLYVSSGRDFLGHYAVPKARSVVYLQAEGNMPETCERLEPVLKVTPFETKNFNLLYDSSFYLDQPDVLSRLMIELQKYHPELIIFDPLYSMLSTGSFNEDNVMSKFVNNVDYIMKYFKCASLILHHTKKPTTNIYGAKSSDNTINAFLGSRVLSAWVQDAYLVQKDGKVPTVRNIVRVKHRAISNVADVIKVKVNPLNWKMELHSESKL